LFGDLGFERAGSITTTVVMIRGGNRLMGLSSQVLGMRSFSTEIFVSKLSFYTTEEELKDIFSPFGSVKQARLMRDSQTGRVKGFGFVSIHHKQKLRKLSRQWMEEFYVVD
ncbi:hypothetical protein EJB05_07124, partial [Eragrostis curvula]